MRKWKRSYLISRSHDNFVSKPKHLQHNKSFLMQASTGAFGSFEEIRPLAKRMHWISNKSNDKGKTYIFIWKLYGVCFFLLFFFIWRSYLGKTKWYLILNYTENLGNMVYLKSFIYSIIYLKTYIYNITLWKYVYKILILILKIS